MLAHEDRVEADDWDGGAGERADCNQGGKGHIQAACAAHQESTTHIHTCGGQMGVPAFESPAMHVFRTERRHLLSNPMPGKIAV